MTGTYGATIVVLRIGLFGSVVQPRKPLLIGAIVSGILMHLASISSGPVLGLAGDITALAFLRVQRNLSIFVVLRIFGLLGLGLLMDTPV